MFPERLEMFPERLEMFPERLEMLGGAQVGSLRQRPEGGLLFAELAAELGRERKEHKEALLAALLAHVKTVLQSEPCLYAHLPLRMCLGGEEGEGGGGWATEQGMLDLVLPALKQ
jgi:hypothetical protein